MNRKKILCTKCGGSPEIHGGDWTNAEGPWHVACVKCGEESEAWAYQRDAWWQWERDNSLFPLRTKDKIKAHDFLDCFEYTKAMYESSYRYWAKHEKAWARTFATGGTYTMRALMWYQHIHKPQSKESRPLVIMASLCELADIRLADM